MVLYLVMASFSNSFFASKRFHFFLLGSLARFWNHLSLVSSTHAIAGVLLRNCSENEWNDQKKNSRMKNVCQTNWMWTTILITISTPSLALSLLMHDTNNGLPIHARFLVSSTYFAFRKCFCCAFGRNHTHTLTRNLSHFACTTTLFWLNCAYLFAYTHGERDEINHDTKQNKQLTSNRPTELNIITNNIVFILRRKKFFSSVFRRNENVQHERTNEWEKRVRNAEKRKLNERIQ